MSSSDNIQNLSNKGYEYFSFAAGTSPLVIPSYPENNSSTSYKVALFAAAFLLAGGLALGGTSVFFYLKAGFALKTWIFIGTSGGSLVGSLTVFVVAKKLKIANEDIRLIREASRGVSAGHHNSEPYHTKQTTDVDNSILPSPLGQSSQLTQNASNILNITPKSKNTTFNADEFIGQLNSIHPEEDKLKMRESPAIAIISGLSKEHFDAVINQLSQKELDELANHHCISHLIDYGWDRLKDAKMSKNLMKVVAFQIVEINKPRKELERIYIQQTSNNNLKKVIKNRMNEFNWVEF